MSHYFPLLSNPLLKWSDVHSEKLLKGTLTDATKMGFPELT